MISNPGLIKYDLTDVQLNWKYYLDWLTIDKKKTI